VRKKKRQTGSESRAGVGGAAKLLQHTHILVACFQIFLVSPAHAVATHTCGLPPFGFLAKKAQKKKEKKNEAAQTMYI
jgi:hypothetical protein